MSRQGWIILPAHLLQLCGFKTTPKCPRLGQRLMLRLPQSIPRLSGHLLLTTAELCHVVEKPPQPPCALQGSWTPHRADSAADPPPLSSTMTVWQRASNRRNSLSTGSLSRRAASSSATSLESDIFSPRWLQVSPDPCKRHGQLRHQEWGHPARLAVGVLLG